MKQPNLIQSFIFCIFIFLIIGCQGEKHQNEISDALREKAIQELDKNLQIQPYWEKVHVAEYKLWSGYKAGVEEVYLEEKRQFETSSPYRIGIWRVLAQASPELSPTYQNKILAAFRDREGPDRIHAAESLAKLGLSVVDMAPDEVKEILEGEKNSLYVYTLWGLANSLNQRTAGQNVLFDFIVHHSGEKVPMMQAAYALRHYGNLMERQWEKLAEIALDEPKESPARVYLLSAAFVQAPESAKTTDIFKNIHSQLVQFKSSSSKGERMEMALALGEAGTSKDLKILLFLLNNEHPILEEGENQETAIQSPSNADVRATAAFSILQMDRKQEHYLALGDWLVVAFYLLGMVGIGYFFSRKNKSENDYYLGGGKMNPIAVGLSLFATLLSSLSYLSYPGEMVKYGPVIFSGILVFPLIYYVVGWFLIPKFMRLRVTSAYEILEINLGVSIRMLATFFFLSLRFLWMGTIIFITVHTAVLSIFGFDSSHTLIISILLMGITIFYTTMGGLKAVVFTDVIQSAVLLGGAIITLLVVSSHFGSFTAWIPQQWMGHWGELRFGLDARERLTIGNALLTTFVWYIASSGSDQMAIQRFLATEDVRSARKTFGVSLITTFVAQALLGLVGLAVLAYFTANPNLLAEGESIAGQADNLFPRFILVGLPVGISGLVAAGILAAAMSSLSSGLNSTSSVISEDLLKRFKKNYRKPKNEMGRIRNLSFFVGVFALVLSIFISKVEGNLYDIIVKVVNLFVSPLFVLFFMALFVPFATARGTFIGGVLSVAIAVAVAFYKLLGIEVLFIMPTSLIVGILTGILASYIDHKFLGNPETAAKRSKTAKIIE